MVTNQCLESVTVLVEGTLLAFAIPSEIGGSNPWRVEVQGGVEITCNHQGVSGWNLSKNLIQVLEQVAPFMDLVRLGRCNMLVATNEIQVPIFPRNMYMHKSARNDGSPCQ